MEEIMRLLVTTWVEQIDEIKDIESLGKSSIKVSFVLNDRLRHQNLALASEPKKYSGPKSRKVTDIINTFSSTVISWRRRGGSKLEVKDRIVWRYAFF